MMWFGSAKLCTKLDRQMLVEVLCSVELELALALEGLRQREAAGAAGDETKVCSVSRVGRFG